MNNFRGFPFELVVQGKIAVARAPATASALESKVVSFLRKTPAAADSEASAVTEESLASLMERASNVARQMRYFALIAKRASFDELVPSAKRAGFAELSKDMQNQEASFRWAAGKPDFIFSVSFKDPEAPSVIAESADDIFGLILASSSHATRISVETSPSVGNKELGRNASIFRDILLMLPDFDDMPAWTKFG
jgi:hypothetical protein